jgi:hypothetical protein
MMELTMRFWTRAWTLVSGLMIAAVAMSVTFLLLPPPTPAGAQRMELDRGIGPALYGTVASTAPSGVWVDVGVTDFYAPFGEQPSLGARIVTARVTNDDGAADSLYVRFLAGGAATTAQAFRVKAGETREWVLGGISGGPPVLMSVQGGGDGTPFRLEAGLSRFR